MKYETHDVKDETWYDMTEGLTQGAGPVRGSFPQGSAQIGALFSNQSEFVLGLWPRLSS